MRGPFGRSLAAWLVLLPALGVFTSPPLRGQQEGVGELNRRAFELLVKLTRSREGLFRLTGGIIDWDICLADPTVEPEKKGICREGHELESRELARTRGLLQNLEEQYDQVERRIDERLASGGRLLGRHRAGDALLPKVSYLSDFAAVTFRRNVGHPLHTDVSGLTSDPGCTGDLAAGSAIGDYYRAAFKPDGRTAAEALTALAEQLTCMSLLQTGVAEIAFVQMVREVEQKILASGDRLLASKWLSVNLNPHLLFFDQTRHLGPVAVWPDLRRHLPVHLAMLSTGQAPLLNIGLYLYDRVTGEMVGFTNLCEKTGQKGKCVSVGTLVQSITDPKNMGFGECPLLEGIPSGYSCTREIIRQLCEGGGARTPSEPSEGSGGESSADSVQISGKTPFGAPLDQFAGEFGLGEGGRCARRPEKGGGGGGGFETPAGRCLAGAVKRPAHGPAQCVGVFQEAKERQKAELLNPASLEGVKLGADCKLSEGGGAKKPDPQKSPEERCKGSSDPNCVEKERAKDQLDAKRKKLDQQFQKETGKKPTDQDYDAAKKAIDKAKPNPVLGLTGKEGTNREGPGGIEFDTGIGQEKKRPLKDLLTHEGAHEIGERLGTTEDQDHRIFKESGIKQCQEPDSCTACTAGSDQLKALEDCMSETGKGPPPSTGGIAPAVQKGPVSYPRDDQGGMAPEGQICTFGGAGNSLLSTTNCLAIDCPDGQVPTLDKKGKCTCSDTSETWKMTQSAWASYCGAMDCPDGLPVMGSGGCRCQVFGGSVGGGGTTPPVGPAPDPSQFLEGDLQLPEDEIPNLGGEEEDPWDLP